MEFTDIEKVVEVTKEVYTKGYLAGYMQGRSDLFKEIADEAKELTKK